MTLVYSLDRERRLRLVLRVGLFTGALLLLLTVFVLTVGSGGAVATGVVAASGVTIVLSTVWALRRLPGRDRVAKAAAVVSGALLLISGITFATSPATGILALGLVALGLAVLALALLPDDPEAVP